MPDSGLQQHPAPRSLRERFNAVRLQTEALTEPLSPEDAAVQSMPDASPAKWHLAHTTWFFEALILAAWREGYRPYRSEWHFLFNSYYESLGPRHPRPERGMLTRPGLAEVLDYRHHVDAAFADLLEERLDDPDLAAMTVLGLNHEQQHQELLLTDILDLFSRNPLAPAYRALGPRAVAAGGGNTGWTDHPGGIVAVGHDGPGFAFDNEGPRHEVLLRPFRIANSLVTNGAWQEFIADGGYQRPEYWLSDGWRTAREHGWNAPDRWRQKDGRWFVFSLHGLVPLDPATPVCHVSFYEADAFARWAGKRLPSESEWETIAAGRSTSGQFADDGVFLPLPITDNFGFFGSVWEWTSSAYGPYPGFKTAQGAVGEYNGKFMCNQMVLRGGSCASAAGHVRSTYRNFFYPHQRWQFMGLRLAEGA